MSDRDLLRLCIWREARGEIYMAKRGVAHVVHNRSLTAAWWNHHMAHILANVILYPYQFSSFNPRDPNETKWPEDDDPAFVDATRIADALIAGYRRGPHLRRPLLLRHFNRLACCMGR